MQSTLARATGGSLSFKMVAAASYSGARRLQCPHHGAKNSTKMKSCFLISVSKLASVKSSTSLAKTAGKKIAANSKAFILIEAIYKVSIVSEKKNFGLKGKSREEN